MTKNVINICCTELYENLQTALKFKGRYFNKTQEAKKFTWIES